MQPAERSAVGDDLHRVIAKLHAVDFCATGLEGFGKVGDYFARQIDHWTRQAAASTRTEPRISGVLDGDLSTLGHRSSSHDGDPSWHRAVRLCKHGRIGRCSGDRPQGRTIG